MIDELNFDDLTPIELPVSVAGKRYVLREATEAAACQWRNAMMQATELGSDGKPTRVRNLADTEPLLVSLCLFTAEEGKPVPVATIKGWPARVVKRLFEKVKDVSDLDEKGKKEPDPNAQDAATEPSA